MEQKLHCNKIIYFFTIFGALLAIGLGAGGLLSSQRAFAGCNCCKPCEKCQSEIFDRYDMTRTDVTNEFIHHKELIINDLFQKNILPAMMRMTEQLTVAAMQQVEAIGAFLDAKHQLETQRVFQELTAEAHKDYYPSEGLCQLGTNVRSLAASERKSEFSAMVIASRALQRQNKTGENLAFDGSGSDTIARFNQYVKTYCNPADNALGFSALCGEEDSDTSGSNNTASVTQEEKRFNKDVDFTQTIENPLTLKIDFAPTGSGQAAQGGQGGDQGQGAFSEDAEDVFALSNNLFAATLSQPITEFSGETPKKNREAALKYLDSRSINAKRSVAVNSYAMIAGQKAEGSEEVAEYIHAILKEMGYGQDDKVIKEMIGEKPSYFAQMEMLTKKIYQDPNFYTNLYDKPINVERKRVALQAIELMQKRDTFRSLLRSESLLSLILESDVVDQQNSIKGEEGN